LCLNETAAGDGSERYFISPSRQQYTVSALLARLLFPSVRVVLPVFRRRKSGYLFSAQMIYTSRFTLIACRRRRGSLPSSSAGDAGFPGKRKTNELARVASVARESSRTSARTDSFRKPRRQCERIQQTRSIVTCTRAQRSSITTRVTYSCVHSRERRICSERGSRFDDETQSTIPMCSKRTHIVVLVRLRTDFITRAVAVRSVIECNVRE